MVVEAPLFSMVGRTVIDGGVLSLKRRVGCILRLAFALSQGHAAHDVRSFV